MNLMIETWPIEKLIPYERNPRNNDSVVDKMVSSFTEFGFRIPIVAKSNGLIIDGHLRYKAAQKMGLKEVPVALADDLTDAQVKAFRILANKSATWATWDTDLLKLEFDDLEGLDFDFTLTGFEEWEIKSLNDLDEEGDGGDNEGDANGEPEKDYFTVSFNFPIEKKDIIEAYIKAVTKDEIVHNLIKLAETSEE